MVLIYAPGVCRAVVQREANLLPVTHRVGLRASPHAEPAGSEGPAALVSACVHSRAPQRASKKNVVRPPRPPGSQQAAHLPPWHRQLRGWCGASAAATTSAARSASSSALRPQPERCSMGRGELPRGRRGVRSERPCGRRPLRECHRPRAPPRPVGCRMHEDARGCTMQDVGCKKWEAGSRKQEVGGIMKR